MAHTPGPWVRRIASHVGGPKDNLTEMGVFQGPWNGHDTEKKIAGKTVDGPISDTDEDDFRLIAAAPDLLAALTALRPLFECGAAEEYAVEIEAAEAAIERAS